MIQVLPADRIVGMMHVTHLAWLATRAAVSRNVVEIGCWRGRTTKALCDNCPGLVTAVDTWRGSPGLEPELDFLLSHSEDPDWLYHEFLFNMREEKNLEVLRMTSLEAAAHLNGTRMFDMIFIDALHDYNSVVADIRAWLPLLSEGGMMCGHDLMFPEVNRAVTDLFPQFPPNIQSDIWAICKGAGSISRWDLAREDNEIKTVSSILDEVR